MRLAAFAHPRLIEMPGRRFESARPAAIAEKSAQAEAVKETKTR